MLTLSLSQVTNLSACEASLKQAYRKQKTFLWKKLGLELQIEHHLDAVSEIDDLLYRKSVDLQRVSMGIDGLPEKARKKREHEQARLQLDILLLEERREKRKPERLIEKETSLQCLEVSLEQLSSVILELEAHKIRLQKEAANNEIADPETGTASAAIPVLKAVTPRQPANLPVKKNDPGAPPHPNGYLSG
ncbi:hypothetical protein [Niabella sp.]|uniref:hypothetical protein n=1 Tax=Niabella sp. TaxID=1962976 RepID=UPI00261543D2|nr:hypothetical protein [Niabella sp.]